MLCTECGRDVPPVVAVDIDGTLGNYHEHFTLFAEAYLNVALDHNYDGSMEFSDFLGIHKDVYRDIKLAYRQGAQKRTMPIYLGADFFMQSLKQNGVEIWIATTRPYLRLDNIDPDTRHWLDRNNLPYDGLIFGKGKYQELLRNVQEERILAVVDDLAEDCYTASELGLQAWQPMRSHNVMARHERRFANWEVAEAIEMRIEQWRDKDGV